MDKSISIVIPNYNGLDLLVKNIPYVISALTSSGITNYEIIVADDASQDASASIIQQLYPQIIWVQNKKNKGFSSNINSGIDIASKDLVLLLNNDVQLQNDYFTHQLPYFKQEDTFGVMATIESIQGSTIQDAAKYPAFDSFQLDSTKNYILPNQNLQYTLFLSGANALVDRLKLQELKGFNTLFDPYYSEDAELGIRAWRLGYKLYYEKKSICKHPNSSTIKKENKDKVKIISRRNKISLHYLHLETLDWRKFHALTRMKSYLRFLIGDRTYLKAYQLFLQQKPELDAQKQAFEKLQEQKQLTKSLRDIVAYIKNEIGSQEKIVF